MEEHKNNRNKYYLAYGSNLCLQQMKKRCATAQVIGCAVMNDYKLLFRGFKDNYYLTIEKAKGYSVPVGVFLVTPNDIANLDAYEGYQYDTIGYDKKNISIEVTHLNGKKEVIKAFYYYMRKGSLLGKPTTSYINTVKEGYRDFKFDQSYILQALKDSK